VTTDEPPILIVDDDADIREALIDILTDHGYHALAVSNGQEALAHLRGGARPRLILLDAMMPVMDGLSFRREQLLDPELSRLPVLMISAGILEDLDIGELGLVGVLGKPIDLDRLLEVVALHYV
jgi:two-component system, chemotaxis family, chemotaxis protein CheY